MSGEGMVAVVQSLQNAGLAVTLLDGSRNRFSLVPNTAQAQPQHPYQTIRLERQSSSAGSDSTQRCDSSAQATDGRYASVYQTTHCNLSPTSPPDHVTEFPPQRAELCPGHGNFVVGGLGSGETGRCPIRSHQQRQYRGGLSWVDRGAVCPPRPSQHIDSFASSLRKYPLSPGSSEMMERLITYSHAKNLSRNQCKGTSPVRSPVESVISHNTYSERSPRRAGHGDVRSRCRVDEYPTREGRPRREELDRRTYNRNYDVRFVRDVSRARDTGRTCNHNCQYRMAERLDSPSYLQRNYPENASTNSVHTETQAVVKMVSKEVATVPKSEPVKKNVAVPQPSSTSIGHAEGAVSDVPIPSQMDQNPAKIVSFKSVQTTSSSIELISTQKQREIRRSKSEDELRRQHFQEGIIQLIGNIAANSKAKDEELKGKILKDMWVKLQKVLENVERQNDREKALIDWHCKKIRKGPILIPVRYERESRKKVRKWAEIDVFRASLPPFRISKTEGFEDIVKDWVNGLPIKSHDFIGRPINKLQICDTLVRKLLKLFSSNATFDYETLKLQILNIIGLVPLEIIGKRNRCIIDSSVDEFVSKLREVAPNMFKSIIISSLPRIKYDKFYKHINTKDNNIKECVLNEMVDFFEKHNLNFNDIDKNKILTELTEITIDFIYEGGIADRNEFREDILSFLKEYNIETDKGVELANVLLKHIKERNCKSMKCGIRNFIACLNTSKKRQRRSTSFYDAFANTDAYKKDLCQQIDEWLNELPIEINKFNYNNTRDAIIDDLAAEIVDRKKYLEFNSSKTTDENELEYLKYQIYKWIDKVVKDENIDIMEHAADLMSRIRDVAVPKLTSFNTNIYNVEVQKTAQPAEPNTSYVNNNNEMNNSNKSTRRPSILKIKNQNGGTKSPMSCAGSNAQQHITIEQLNNDYDEYVKKWVEQIPIPSASPEERELADKLRIGIHNGVWKALTKLKFDPGTYHNSFYYQDLLDNELEDLFNSLPNSPELDAKKHILKAQLLEETTNTHEKIKKLAKPATFKQALVENVANSIPKILNEDQDNPIKKFEDLQILGIVEDFIVIANYEEDNQVIANTFKKKLIKKAEAFVEELKKSHGKELKDIDINTYTQDIIDALSSVPTPSEDSVKDEAEEIMLGIDIEHWFNDLPLIPNDDYDEQLQRRRLRDRLAKKLADVQKSNLEECASETAFKREITNFLQKVPLQPGEEKNIDFMVEELINRIRNKKRERGNTRRRSVVFEDDIKYPSYHEFSKELPHCSSFSCNQSNQYNKSSIHPNDPGNADFHRPYYQNLNDSAIIGGGMLPTNASMNGDRGYTTFKEVPPLSSSIHPYHVPQNMNESTFIGGGMSNKVVPTNASIYGGRGYTSFEEFRPLSSSMHPSHMVAPDMNENVQLSQLLKSKWSTFEGTHPSQSPYNVPVTSNAQQVAGPDSIWYSLEEVEIPPEMRSRCQSPARKLQSLKSMTYVDSQDQSNQPGQQPVRVQRPCCTENKDTSQYAQVTQDQISRINQAATGHTVDDSQIRDINQVDNSNQNLDTSRRTNEIGQTNDNINQALETNEVYNQNMNRFSEISPNFQTNRLLNQSDIPKTNVDITQINIGNRSLGAVPTQAPLVQTQQNLFNRSIEVSRTPRSPQYIPQVPIQHVQRSPSPVIQYSPQQIQLQDIPNIGSEVIQTPQNRSIYSEIPPIPRATLTPQVTPQQYLSPQFVPAPLQIPGQNIPEIIEPQQISQQIQTQPSGSSYGQPQGFSTPHQEPNQRSPPRIGRKPHDPSRFRSGPARRRLDLDDDEEESEEDCPCIARLKRRYSEDLDYPCFCPFGYPHQYYF